MKRFSRALGIGLAIAMLVAGCGPKSTGGGTGEMAQPKTLTKVKVAMVQKSTSVGLSYVWIPSYLGYYKDEGLDVEVLTTDGAQQALQLLVAGQIDFTCPSPDVALSAAAKGPELPVVDVFTYAQKTLYRNVAVLPDSPIKELKDLKGKKIGVLSLGSPTDLQAQQILKSVGLDPKKDAEIFAVGQDVTAYNVLKKGDVDALVLWTTSYVAMENAGAKLRYISTDHLTNKLLGNGITVTRETLEKRKDVAVRFLRAFARGVVFWQTNPEAVVRIHWAMYPESKPKGVDEAKALKDAIRLVESRSGDLSIDHLSTRKWGWHDKNQWEAYVDYLGLNGKVKDVSTFFSNDLLDEVNKFDEQKVLEFAKTYKFQPKS